MGEHSHIGIALAIIIPLALLLFSGSLAYWIVQPFKPHLTHQFNAKPKSTRRDHCCHRH